MTLPNTTDTSKGLRVRSTFIEVFSTADKEAAALRRSRRSASAPSWGRLPGQRLQEEQSRYLALLSERIESLGASDVLEYFGRAGDADKAFMGAVATDASTSCSLGSNEAREASSGSDEPLGRDVGSRRRGAWADACDSEGELAPTVSATTRAAHVKAYGAADVDVSACSVGSAGHPELCSRGCLRFGAGLCTLGQGCPYCHLTHDKRDVHMDRKNRDLLREAGPRIWLQIFGPALEARMKVLGVGAALRLRLTHALDACARLGAASTGEGKLLPRHRKNIVTMLQSMSTKTLLSSASRTFGTFSPEGGELFRSLLGDLRAAVGGVAP